MTRKQFLSLAATAAGGPQLAPGRPAGRSAAGKPRNVLFLLSDQHRPGALGADGHPVAVTPNLDLLAQSGTQFGSAYCADPICAPSRASLLTGLYPHRHRVYNNTSAWPFEHKTIAHAFSRAGYMSALIGKMHFIDAQTHGFDYRLDFNDWLQYLGPKAKVFAAELGGPGSGSGLPQIDDLWRDYGDPWKDFRDKENAAGGLPERDHFESFVARESVRFLRNHAGKQPFFLISSFLKPHAPLTPAERFASMFQAQEMQVPTTFGKVDSSSVSRDTAERIQRYARNLNDSESVKRRIALYYANLAQMDDAAGMVLRALRELGLEDDTIVVYTSDHGEMLGEHGLWQKFVFYEPSVGVPLIFRVPGLTARNKRCATPVSLVQLFPTLCELCGVPVPSGLDGASLLPDLAEPARTHDASVFSEFDLGTPQAKYMLRRGRSKYSFYVNDAAEMYDLAADPDEMNNLARLPRYQRQVQQMKAELLAWHTPAGIGTPRNK